ncbi:MAG: Ig-like domain-containing protein [Candidatus Cryptobacteroides sp.]|nr:Ig-like domain-containing protein [Candidatus Cryptobacteroides sp.]
MKTLFKTFAYAAIAALALSSCAKEKLQPADELTGKLVTVHFGTENTDPSTKATLTPDAGETAFQAAWENKDQISIEYISPDAHTDIIVGTWDATNKKFSASLPNETGSWEYSAAYPVPSASDNSVDFGANRTQKGNVYNSKYDIMIGAADTKNSAAGKDDNGKDIVFPMTRQTAIAYFHFTSDLDEAITSATLTVGGDGAAIASSSAHISNFVWDASEDLTSITITFPEKAPNAQDFQLWFNVLPTSYSLMTLTVETDTKTFTISKNSKGKYEAGKLYKVKKGGISWTDKPTTIFFYESFDKTIGTGGNDDAWSGSIASNNVIYDNKEWNVSNEGGASKCLKLGTGSKKGSATTPSLGINTSKATLWFKAAAWNASKEKTTINLSIIGAGTIAPTSVNLVKGQWSEYDCTITGADATTKIKFEAFDASDNRFFIDEVYVYSGPQPVVKANQIISFSETSYSIFINDDFTGPTLSGAKTSVTYVSDNEKVVTVESTTGAITIVGAGTAKITATAEETEEYRFATASYTITVKKLSQTLSFEKPAYSINIEDASSFVSPVATGASTNVSYSILLTSETQAGAMTIDSQSGQLTITSVGEATVTASAEETDTYYSATASYTIKVLDHASSVKWVLVEDLSNLTEGTYILASVKSTNTWRYMPNTKSSNTNPSLKELSVPSNKTIEDVDVTSDMKWNLVSTGTDNQYYIRPNGDASVGLGCTADTGKYIRISSNYKNMKWTFSTSSSANWQIKNDATKPMYLAVYADDAWRNYTSSSTNQYGKFYIFKQVSN